MYSKIFTIYLLYSFNLSECSNYASQNIQVRRSGHSRYGRIRFEYKGDVFLKPSSKDKESAIPR